MRNDTSSDLPLLLTLDQASQLVGMGSRTLFRHSRNGLAPSPKKIGGLTRYVRQELIDWCNRGCKSCEQGGRVGEGNGE